MFKAKFYLSLLLTLGFFAFEAHSQFLNWTFVDALTDVKESGLHHDYVVGSDGSIHISYWQREEDKLIYVHRPAGSSTWIREYVDPLKVNGYQSSITLDAQGTPWFAFYENVGGVSQLRIAHRVMQDSFMVEEVPGDIVQGWGEYGPNGLNTSTERLVGSIDMKFDTSARLHVFFFNSWMKQGAFPACNPDSDYELNLNHAYQQNGIWVARGFDLQDDIYGNCCDPFNAPCNLPNGDRFGEYCQANLRADGIMEVVTMSRFNGRLITFYSDSTDTTWSKVVVDSLDNMLPNSSSWQWTRSWFTVEGIGAYSAPDTTVHYTYTTSLFYGENFCCTDGTNNLLYARSDSQGVFTFHSFGVGSYRNHTGITGKGSDTLFVVYSDLNAGNILMQQSYDGGLTWALDTLVVGAFTVSNSNVFIQDDMINVILFDAFREELMLATRQDTGGDWQFENITRSQSHGRSMDAQVFVRNQDTIAWMVYNEPNYGNLFFSQALKNNGWNWAPVQLDSVNAGYESISLAKSSNDEPVLVYGNGINRRLRLAYRDGSNWNYETLDSTLSANYTALAVSSLDTIYLACYDGVSRCLYFGRRHLTDTGASFQFDPVDCANAPVGEFVSMAIDGNDDPVLAYYDDFSLSLKYATRSSQTRSWNVETVYSNTPSPVGKYCSLKMNANDQPVIAFTDEQKTSVLLAERNAIGNWNITLIDSSDVYNIGRPLELEIDKFGNPWVAYNYYFNYDRIKLMHRDTAWREVSVSTRGRLANSFAFEIQENDLYILGQKTELANTGLGMIFAPRGLFINVDDPMEKPFIEAGHFPNPSNGQVTFRILNEKPARVTLEITDMRGRLVARLMEDQFMSAGQHDFAANLANLGQGLFFYSVRGDGFRIQKKLLLVR